PLLAWITRWGYTFQLRFTPWLIGPIFAIKTHPWIAPLIRALFGWRYGRRLRGVIHRCQPDVIISTFPVTTAVLDRLCRTRSLTMPVLTVIADYGVHAQWVGPATTLHIVSSPMALPLVKRAHGRGRVAQIPVDPRFEGTISQAQARTRCALPHDRRIALIMAGAWGVGSIAPAVAEVIAAGWYPVVITGRNVVLYQRLSRQYADPGIARILGWTDDIPLLMAAADCLIQNGGGMTCHEAAAIGIPVLFYQPLPGHGELNARVMEAAGAACWIGRHQPLTSALQAVAEHRLAPPPRDGTPLSRILSETLASPASASLASPPASRTAWRPRMAALAACLLLAMWIGLTPWSGGVGAMFASPAIDARALPVSGVALVVRTADPAVARYLEDAIETEHLPVALFVTAPAATGLRPTNAVVIGLAQDGQTAFLAHPARERHLARKAAAAIRQLTGKQTLYILPPSGGATVLTTVMSPRNSRPLRATRPPERLNSPSIVLLDVTHLGETEALDHIHRTLDDIRQAGLQCVTLPWPS
ncbi:MAG: hypothetical protein C4346_15675, partial [Chloroflexota bacterium]